MKNNVKLHINDYENISISFGEDKYGDGMVVGIAKPMGVTMSAAEVTDVHTLIRDVYHFSLGDGTTPAISNVKTIMEYNLFKFESVNESFKLKEDI